MWVFGKGSALRQWFHAKEGCKRWLPALFVYEMKLVETAAQVWGGHMKCQLKLGPEYFET